MSTEDFDAKTTPGRKLPRVGVVEDGEVLAGRYRLVRFIASGGMGEVWEAEDLSLHEHVALKTVRAEALTPELLERFRHEVKLARRVTHPNVCRVFEFGEHTRPTGEKVSFLTMELLSGRPLEDELRRRGRFTLASALPLLEQMAAGLDAAHAQGIVHRDFKSPNVFLEGTTEPQRVVITDFGLARAVGADVRVTTTPQQMMGTPAYMAPEQVLGADAGPAADIFALGVVAFEMVTGALPFAAETTLATALKRLSEPPRSARSLVPEVPEHWERALFVAMARQPGDRFASASQFIAALRAPGASSTSLPVPVPAPLAVPVRRSKTVLRWLVVAFVAIAVGKKVSTFRTPQPPSEESQKRQELQALARSASAAMRRCYEAQLPKTPDLEGRLEFRLEIDAAAEHVAVSVERDTMGSPEVAACAMTELRAIKPTKALASTTAVYPFVFKNVSSVAIAPFENLTRRAEDDWLSGAMSEALATKLGQLDDLPLVDRAKLRSELATASADQGVSAVVKAARSAGAGRLVRGTFQHTGSKLRVDAELVDVARNVLRATVEVTGEVDDVFALQDSLAKKLADAFAVEGTRASDEALNRHTGGTLAVLQLLGKASNALTGTQEPVNPRKAEVLYRQVIELEPGIAEAHLGLAWALWAAHRDATLVTEPVAAALRLRPDYYEALTFSGFTLWHLGKFEEALEAQRHAVKLKPQFGEGYYGLALNYASLGKPDEALVTLDQAIEFAPRNPEYVTQKGYLLVIFHRDLTQAVEWVDRAVTMPGSAGWNQLVRAFVHLMAGDPLGCLGAIDLARGGDKTDPRREFAHAVEVACLARAGRTDEARALWLKLPHGNLRRAAGFEQVGVDELMKIIAELDRDAGR